MRRPFVWLPLAAFVVMLAIVGFAMYRPADRQVRSALVGKPLPRLALPPIVAGKPGIAGGFGNGRARLVNVFGSWCVPCIAEAPQLMRLKAMGVAIDGVAVRDTGAAVTAFLARNGDPFARIGDDRQGRVQLSIGSSGVPETFVIDANGVIIYQHVGDIRSEDVPRLAALVAVR